MVYALRVPSHDRRSYSTCGWCGRTMIIRTHLFILSVAEVLTHGTALPVLVSVETWWKDTAHTRLDPLLEPP